jgi:hypothetical protein
MFELVQSTPKEVFITYIVVLSACALTYPGVKLIATAITEGRRASRWR